jgi:hypothetical protein
MDNVRCTGHGRTTVVFDNGLTTDWYALQNRLSDRWAWRRRLRLVNRALLRRRAGS